MPRVESLARRLPQSGISIGHKSARDSRGNHHPRIHFALTLAHPVDTVLRRLFIGLVESYLYGWYFALIFVPLYRKFDK